jgi:hypothetical protein
MKMEEIRELSKYPCAKIIFTEGITEINRWFGDNIGKKLKYK